MSARALSVDYGSSSTVAALRDPDGRGRLLLFDSSPLLPSAVCADADGMLVGGKEAQHLARVHPERYEPTPKRRLDQSELLLGPTAYPVVDAVAVTLRLVAAAAREAIGAAPDAVTVTHPAGWAAPRRRVLVDAARRAGLPEPALVPEPVAAARHFRSRADCPPGPLVVYDLGAGTCDVSVIADDGTVLAVDGIDDLGGTDLDELVVSMVAEAVPGDRLDRWRAMTAPTTGADRRYFRLLWDDARAARELLSRRSGTHLHLPALEVDAPIGRERFEQAAGPVLMRSAGLTAGLIGRAGTTPAELAGIVLVGGASRTPLVATLLHQTVGVAPTMLDQPELVVAEGGLLTAAPAGTSTGAGRAGAGPAAGDAPRTALPGAELPGTGQADPQLSGVGLADAELSGVGLADPQLSGVVQADSESPSAELAGAGRSSIAVSGTESPRLELPGAGSSPAEPPGTDLVRSGPPDADLREEASKRAARPRWPWWPILVVLLLGLVGYATDDISLAEDGKLPMPITAAALIVGGYAAFTTARRARPGLALDRFGMAGGVLLAAAALSCPAAYLLYGDDDFGAGAALPLPFMLVCGAVAGVTGWRGGGRRTGLPVAVLGTALLYGMTSAAVFLVIAVENPEDPTLARPAIRLVVAGMIAALLATAGLVLAGRRVGQQR